VRFDGLADAGARPEPTGTAARAAPEIQHRPPNEACPVANIKSQIKRNRQSAAAHERNKSVKSAVKSAVRRFREAADAGNVDEAKRLAAHASRKLDKAASAGVIHKNQAANKKSAIGKRAASL
jgi:small subunit ribosomal protein S20